MVSRIELPYLVVEKNVLWLPNFTSSSQEKFTNSIDSFRDYSMQFAVMQFFFIKNVEVLSNFTKKIKEISFETIYEVS